MILEIPASSFTKKIVDRDFQGIIDLKDRHPLSYILHYRKSGLRSKTQAKFKRINLANQRNLNQVIKVKVKKSINNFVLDEMDRLGNHIHDYYIDKFLNHVYALVLMKIKVTVAIRHFNDLYNIDEDDISFETQYKAWQRHWKSLHANDTISTYLKKKRHLFVLKDLQADIVIKELPRFELIKDIVSRFFISYPDHYESKKNITRDKIMEYAQIYLYRNLTLKKPELLAQEISDNENHYSKYIIYRWSRKFSKILKQDRVFRIEFERFVTKELNN